MLLPKAQGAAALPRRTVGSQNPSQSSRRSDTGIVRPISRVPDNDSRYEASFVPMFTTWNSYSKVSPDAPLCPGGARTVFSGSVPGATVVVTLAEPIGRGFSSAVAYSVVAPDDPATSVRLSGRVPVNTTRLSFWTARAWRHQSVCVPLASLLLFAWPQLVSAETVTELWRGGNFNCPSGVSVDPADGSVWVADTENYQVVHLAADGTELWRGGPFIQPHRGWLTTRLIGTTTQGHSNFVRSWKLRHIYQRRMIGRAGRKHLL